MAIISNFPMIAALIPIFGQKPPIWGCSRIGFSFTEKIEENLKTHDIFLEENIKNVHDEISTDESEKTEIINYSAWIFKKK